MIHRPLLLHVNGLWLLLLVLLSSRSACAQQQQPDDIDGFVSQQAASLDQLDPGCWTWKSTLMGTYLEGSDPISKRYVWLTDGCAKACQENQDCKAWSFDWKGECFLLSNVTAVRRAGDSDGRGFAAIAMGKKGSSDCRSLDERHPCIQHNVKILWSDISYKYADANLTVDECQQACIDMIECRFFTHIALPGQTRQCFMKNAGVDDNKVCSEHATSGFVYARDCGAPSEPLEPADGDVQRLTSQGLSLSLELLQSSYPPYPVAEEAYEKVNVCGCYKEATKPYFERLDGGSDMGIDPDKPPEYAPGSAEVIQEVPTYLMPPRRCQLFCQAHAECEHFSSRWNRCSVEESHQMGGRPGFTRPFGAEALPAGQTQRGPLMRLCILP
ncbi:unnamed protein product [Vitrella brassicaformis CCMP3155]|uniref:Apple domain-containing protein n=1 Tax=Vitrella brassicaformis (strain CCMP3155) TaxID=1169540 RepID=A0A0G4GU04_VITBC|nr:unnamed protein product [Vitrella brassicaformis CCMP3155]|eukprot:CEM34105.1 unnamed protein product [Vitrella brassicaformis CCMP3155]